MNEGKKGTPAKRKTGRPKVEGPADVAVRLPAELLARAEALIPILEKTDLGVAMRWSGAAVMRLALHKGLRALELEYNTLRSAQAIGPNLEALAKELADIPEAPPEAVSAAHTARNTMAAMVEQITRAVLDEIREVESAGDKPKKGEP